MTTEERREAELRSIAKLTKSTIKAITDEEKKAAKKQPKGTK